MNAKPENSILPANITGGEVMKIKRLQILTVCLVILITSALFTSSGMCQLGEKQKTSKKTEVLPDDLKKDLLKKAKEAESKRKELLVKAQKNIKFIKQLMREPEIIEFLKGHSKLYLIEGRLDSPRLFLNRFKCLFLNRSRVDLITPWDDIVANPAQTTHVEKLEILAELDQKKILQAIRQQTKIKKQEGKL